MSYYTNYTYTRAQAAHAQRVVIDLIQKRRFFLSPGEHYLDRDSEFVLDPRVFADAIDLDSKVTTAYKEARDYAATCILGAETLLGVSHAQIPEHRDLVECRRYTGGFDICRVYPLVTFRHHMPTSLERVRDELYAHAVHGIAVGDLSPNKVARYTEYARSAAEKVWSQMSEIELQNPDNHRCVVLLKSRFECGSSDKNDDFAQSKVRDLQHSPHVLGYLLWKHSHVERLVPHNFIACSTSYSSHVVLEHWRKQFPSIRFSSDAGYSCKVHFATIL